MVQLSTSSNEAGYTVVITHTAAQHHAKHTSHKSNKEIKLTSCRMVLNGPRDNISQLDITVTVRETEILR